MRFRRYLASLVFLPIFFSAAATARDWHEYQSDNFTVYSDVSKGKVYELLGDLEQFRQAVLFITQQPETLEDQRLQLFYFNSSRQLKKFTGNGSTAGFYRDTWDGPLIMSKAAVGGFSGIGIAFHEYVHHLLRQRNEASYPKWYSEGFAEFLASATLEKDAVWIGNAPKWRWYAFFGRGAGSRPLPLREILKPDPENRSDLYANSFYAGAWLLTHYLQFGASYKGESYEQETEDYFRALKAGEDPLTAFERCYGKSVEEMQHELNRYARGKLRSRKVRIPEYQGDISQRKLPDNERRFLLGEKAWIGGDDELARMYLDSTDLESGGWQANLALLAKLEFRAGNPESAAKLVEKAGSEEVEDYRTAANLALYYADRLGEQKKADQWSEDFYQGAVRNAEAAIAMNPDHLPAYRALWRVQKMSAKPLDAFKTMMAGYQRKPGNLFLNSAIGFHLASLDRVDLAAPFLRNVLAWTHGGKAHNRAKRILEKADSGPSPAAGGETPVGGHSRQTDGASG